MFDFATNDTLSKAEKYAALNEYAHSLTQSETDLTANMANVAALMWQMIPDINWAGFYRVMEDELVLGPFQGKPACIRIPFGTGVCGAAAQTLETQLVADVHAFPGHIACDGASASELVVPIIRDGKCLGVIDIDSPLKGRFDEDDAAGIECLARHMREIWE